MANWSNWPTTSASNSTRKQRHTIEAVVDRLVIDDKIRVRLGDSVETALRWGEGRLVTLHQPGGPGVGVWTETLHSNRNYSPATGRSYEPLTPKHFSFNSPAGACPVCHGLGQKLVFDESAGGARPGEIARAGSGAALAARRQADGGLLQEHVARAGAALPAEAWRRPGNRCRRISSECCCMVPETEDEFNFWRAGQDEQDHAPVRGGDSEFGAALPGERERIHPQPAEGFHEPAILRRLRRQRLKPEILAVTIGGADTDRAAPLEDSHPSKPANVPGLSIMEVCALSVEAADDFSRSLKLTEFQQKIANEVIREIRARLGFLKNVGWVI
jgi:excinuclease ABC subunit A